MACTSCRDRERLEAELRAQLKKEWQLAQVRTHPCHGKSRCSCLGPLWMEHYVPHASSARARLRAPP
jgi:hypothetical protein